MNSRWMWMLSRLARRIWFRATLFSLLAVVTALFAIVASPFIPADLPAKIGADAVDSILSIIASSMLAVTTFSLSTMVAAYSAASGSVTPRARRIIMEDSTTQNVLATFIGSFLFSLVGIIALTTGAYGERGRLVLFVVTIAVVVVVVGTLLRWIDHLSRLGSVTETTAQVEKAAMKAIRALKARPNLGGVALSGLERWRGGSGAVLTRNTVGYVQHVDMAALSGVAERDDVEIAVVAIAGTLVTPGEPIAYVSRPLDDETSSRLAAAFTIDDVRSFDQDPRFGASVLTEIASRALSPAVNDPGTAIDVISRAMRLLVAYGEESEGGAPKVQYPRIHVRAVRLGDLYDDLFTPIARDGAGLVEVGLRLQKAFVALARLDGPGFRTHAMRHAREALERAEEALRLEADKARLRAVAETVGAAV